MRCASTFRLLKQGPRKPPRTRQNRLFTGDYTSALMHSLPAAQMKYLAPRECGPQTQHTLRASSKTYHVLLCKLELARRKRWIVGSPFKGCNASPCCAALFAPQKGGVSVGPKMQECNAMCGTRNLQRRRATGFEEERTPTSQFVV
jgi:hypothetical protein